MDYLQTGLWMELSWKLIDSIAIMEDSWSDLLYMDKVLNRSGIAGRTGILHVVLGPTRPERDLCYLFDQGYN